MSNPNENGSPEAPKVDDTQVPNSAAAPAAQQTASVSINISFGAEQFVNLVMALVGAGLVVAAFSALQYVGALFAGAIPFIFGGILFSTLLSAFFLLLRVQKTVRLRPALRISAPEAFTAAAIFLIMGCFATACMHAFLADGLALEHWTKGVEIAAASFVCYGLGKGLVALWKEGKTSRS